MQNLFIRARTLQATQHAKHIGAPFSSIRTRIVHLGNTLIEQEDFPRFLVANQRGI